MFSAGSEAHSQLSPDEASLVQRVVRDQGEDCAQPEEPQWWGSSRPAADEAGQHVDSWGCGGSWQEWSGHLSTITHDFIRDIHWTPGLQGKAHPDQEHLRQWTRKIWSGTWIESLNFFIFYVCCRAAKNSPHTSWTCFVNNLGPDRSHQRRSTEWSTSSIENLTQSKSSWNNPPARQSWSSDPGSWMLGGSGETSARMRAKFSTSISTHTYQTPIQARKPRRNWRASATSLFHR